MSKTLFLYIDILGFTDLVMNNAAGVARLFRIIDSGALHRDTCYKAIVFSDTVLVYNTVRDLSGNTKSNELMFLMELVQDLLYRITGSNIFFRAIITEDDFTHEKLGNLDAFYGPALINAYRAEKKIIGTGLFLQKSLEEYNLCFPHAEYSPEYDFIYLTQRCSSLHSLSAFEKGKREIQFPIPPEIFLLMGLAAGIYPELIHFQEIYWNMQQNPDPRARAKHEFTWSRYELVYPSLMKTLVAHGFSPNALSNIDWGETGEIFRAERIQ